MEGQAEEITSEEKAIAGVWGVFPKRKKKRNLDYA
jgi:hypothetical protein